MVRSGQRVAAAAEPSDYDIVTMADSPYIETGKKWVVDNYPYNSYHLLKSLEWLDRIAPGSSEALRVATLTHDMERAFPGPDQPVAGPGQWGDPAYNAAHAARSARIVAEWLSGRERTKPWLRK